MSTFTVKKKVETFRRKIDLAIPPENPQVTGHILVDYRVRTKDEVKALSDRALPDEEYFPEIVVAVHGLGDEAGNELAGQAAIDEVLKGHFSMWLTPAVVTAYFEQFGEARRGNSRTRR